MRRKALVIVLIVSMLFSGGAAFAFQNEPEGFRGLNWGDPPTENMQFLGEQFGNRRVYFRLDDKLKMGQAPLQTVIYFFYGESEKLFTVTLYFNGRSNYEELKTICRARFGEGTEEGTNSICWISPETMVHLIFWHQKGVGELHLVCGPLHQEFVDAEQERQAESAEEDW